VPDSARTDIDRSSATPLYLQLEQIFRGEIQAGRYRPGDLLPSEAEICERFDVSRSVVRHTLQNLAYAGLIQTARGRGSFVAEEKLSERFVQRASGFYDDLTSLGLDIRTAVVHQGVDRVPPEVRDFLGVDEAVRIDRVRSVAGRVLAYVVTYLPADRVPGLEDQELADRSLYAHLKATYDLRVHAGHRSVDAVLADDHIARHLEVEPGAPLLLLRSAGRTEDGRPLEWFDAWHRADRTRFEVEIVPDELALPFQQTIVASDRHVPRWTASERTGPPPPAGPPGPSPLEEALRSGRCVAEVEATHYGDGGALTAAFVESGLSVVAFSLTGENALVALEQAAAVDGVLLGASAVRTPEQARRAVDAGARFLTVPARSARVVEAVPGVPVVLAGHTPTEVLEAYELTGGPVALFPAETGGPAHVRAVATAFPEVPLLPTGGVDAGNAAAFLLAGALAVSVGVAVGPEAAVRDGDGAELRRRARELRRVLEGANP
jgi:GntR family transcriptional regulator